MDIADLVLKDDDDHTEVLRFSYLKPIDWSGDEDYNVSLDVTIDALTDCPAGLLLNRNELIHIRDWINKYLSMSMGL